MTDDQSNMLRELLEYDGGALTGWEIDFIESCEKRDESTYGLSEKQDAVLRKIWAKVFGD